MTSSTRLILASRMLRMMPIIAAMAMPATHSRSAQAGWMELNFSASFNARLQNGIGASVAGGINLPSADTGSQIFGGVPFYIPTNDPNGNNYWNSAYASGAGSNVSETLTIATNIFDATQVNTLINTYGGEPGPVSYAYIEFFGTGGAFYKYNLVGDSDVRDFNNDGYTNTINGTTTTQVLSYNDDAQGGRLDMQRFELPSSFLGQTLTSIVLVDNGSNTPSNRIFLAGISAYGVPEPTSFVLLGLGSGCVLAVSAHRAMKRSGRPAHLGHADPC
jgi:hypothetical protein